MKKVLIIFYILFCVKAFTQCDIPKSVIELENCLKKFKQSDSNNKIQYLKGLYKKTLPDSIQADVIYNIARSYFLTHKTDSALLYIERLEQSYDEKINPRAFSFNLLYKGKIYNQKNDPNKALLCYNKALKISENTQDYKSQSYVLNNIARLYRKESDTTEALKFYHLSLKAGTKAGRNLSPMFNNIGVLYFQKNKDSAIYYFDKALHTNIEYKDTKREKISYTNLAHAYLRKENTTNYPLALKYLYQADSLATLTKTSNYFILFYKGLYYEKTGDYDKAQQFYLKTLQHPDAALEHVQHIKVLDQVYQFYEKNKQYDKALAVNKQYHYLKDSIYSVEKNRAFNDIKTKYDVEKKDHDITLLQKENDLATTRRNWIITSSVLISLGLIGLFLFYRQRAKSQQSLRVKEQELFNTEKDRLEKTKELAQAQALINGQDKERHRIATELHDGVGGKLSSVHLALSHTNQLQDTDLQQLNAHIKESLEEIRSISHGLSNNYITGKTLKTIFLELKNQAQQKNIALELSLFPEQDLDQLPQPLKHHLYRITQELLNNTIKHAQATAITLSINLHNDYLNYMFEDNGIGYPKDSIKKGIGLKNIEERTTAINATLHIDSHPQRGTHITIEVPIEHETH